MRGGTVVCGFSQGCFSFVCFITSSSHFHHLISSENVIRNTTEKILTLTFNIILKVIRKGRGSQLVDQVRHPTADHQPLQLLWTVQLTLLPLLQKSSVKIDQEHPVSNSTPCFTSCTSIDSCLV